MNYDSALQSLHAWATGTPAVRAVVMTGSGGAQTPHPLSDRDLEVFTEDVDALVADESWWGCLGEVLAVERLENGHGELTRLVYYAGGKLDFTLLPIRSLSDRIYDRPFEVLLDKDGLAPAGEPAAMSWEAPDADTFSESMHWAYAAALMCAKAIARDELWTAKLRDNDLKAQLLEMIEWDHRTRHGSDYDTRYLGTRMNTWMDPSVRAELHYCWGRFATTDSADALRASLSLYARLCTRTAASLDLPDFAHDRLALEIDAILATVDL